MDNYEIARDRAQAHFLGFAQEKIIQAWNLPWDENFLYVHFLGQQYAVCRKTGRITAPDGKTQAGFSEVLSIFDFLCHEGQCKFASGKFAPVNSLQGSPKTGGVGTNFHRETAKLFDQNPDAFRRVCLDLGGSEVEMGDMGFQFPLFADLSVIVKFYYSDEELPASVTVLWDQNLLQYIYYETVFYIAGFFLQSICSRMARLKA